jgi:hypothetical protein
VEDCKSTPVITSFLLSTAPEIEIEVGIDIGRDAQSLTDSWLPIPPSFPSQTQQGGERKPQENTGWHIDNDYFRHFLDSSSNALTIINCFTDILPRGGGTVVAEDGIDRIVKVLYDHPEGLDPPFDYLCAHCKGLEKYVTVSTEESIDFVLGET